MFLKDRINRFFVVSALTLTLFLASVLVVTLNGVVEQQRTYAVKALGEALQAELENKVGTLLGTLARNLYDPLYYYDFEEIGRLLRQTAEDADTRYIYLADADFKLVHDGHQSYRAESLLDRGLSLPAPGQRVVHHDSHSEFFYPVSNDAGVVGYVIAAVESGSQAEFSRRIEQASAESEVQTRWLIGAVVLMVLLLIWVTAGILRRSLLQNVVRPVEQLAEAAERLGAEQLHEPVPACGDHELVQLAHSFEVMRNSLAQARQKERRLAYYDRVTDLPNRAAFREALEKSVRDGTPFALLFCDLDRFKQVNDTWGHAVGDSLLLAFGNRITSRLRESTRIRAPLYRLGGDEFVLILTDDPDDETTREIANQLVAWTGERFEVDGRVCEIGVSIGVARWPDQGKDADSLLQQADEAMYRAKKKGRNQVFVAS